MSKRAEEAAMKAYPVSISADSIEENFDWNEEYRGIYTEGYEQAVKDTIQRIRDEAERRLEELNPKQGEFAGRPLRSVNPMTFPRESELEKLLSFLDELEKE